MSQNKPPNEPCNTVIQYQPPMVTTARRTQPAMNGQVGQLYSDEVGQYYAGANTK